MPVSPPTTARLPNVPLLVAKSRGGRNVANSSGAFSRTEARAVLSMPIGATVTAPARSRPCAVKRPGFPAMNVTVCVARTAASPSSTIVPVSLSRPLGTSSASTPPPCGRARVRCESRRAMSANTPSSGRARPMPNMPSTSHVYPSNEAGGAWVIETPFARAVSSAQRASSGFTSTGMHSSVAMPALCSCVARISASPPLLPGPAISQTRWRDFSVDVSRVICSRRKLAAALPARSISVCAGSDAAACVSAIRRSVSVSSGSARFCGRISVGGVRSASVMARTGRAP